MSFKSDCQLLFHLWKWQIEKHSVAVLTSVESEDVMKSKNQKYHKKINILEVQSTVSFDNIPIVRNN